MKFWIPIGDNKICVQKVKRGETEYIRLCPVTMFKPTPKQLQVRMTFAKGAYDAFGSSENEVVASVQDAFKDWIKSEPEHRNDVFKLLQRYIPGNPEAVVEFLQQYS